MHQSVVPHWSALHCTALLCFFASCWLLTAINCWLLTTPTPCQPPYICSPNGAGRFRAGEPMATDCNFVIGGYYWTGSAVEQCAVNTVSSTYDQSGNARPASGDAILCKNCATGLDTGGQVGQTTCTFASPGYYNLNSTPTQCPANTYAATSRSFDTATTCTSW